MLAEVRLLYHHCPRTRTHTHTHTLIGISTTCMHGLDTRSHTHTKAGFVFLSGRRSVRVLWVVRRCVNYLNMLLMVSIQ